VVLVNIESLTNTTPSARTDVASRLFLLRAATPPQLRRGPAFTQTFVNFGQLL
jgi:hypothetical protein